MHKRVYLVYILYIGDCDTSFQAHPVYPYCICIMVGTYLLILYPTHKLKHSILCDDILKHVKPKEIDLITLKIFIINFELLIYVRKKNEL